MQLHRALMAGRRPAPKLAPKPREREPAVAEAIRASIRAENLAVRISGALYGSRLALGEIGGRAMPLDSRSQEQRDADWAAHAMKDLKGITEASECLRDAVSAAIAAAEAVEGASATVVTAKPGF